MDPQRWTVRLPDGTTFQGPDPLAQMHSWWFDRKVAHAKPPAASTVRKYLAIRNGPDKETAVEITVALSNSRPIALTKIMEEEMRQRQRAKNVMKKQKKSSDGTQKGRKLK
jgi:hypothetical protein